MIRVYIAAIFIAALGIVYAFGVRIGREQCRADTANHGIETNNEIITEIGTINDTVIKTGTGDIRRILCDRYTIAD